MAKNESRSEHEEVREDGTYLVSEIAGWWEAVTKDNEGNAHIHRLEKHSTKERQLPDPADYVTQAQPVIIKPTRRAKPSRDVQTEVFFGDTHHPFQDKAKMELARIALIELQPDRVTFVGDDLDFATFSSFENKKEWAESTQRGLDEFAQTLGMVKAETDAEVVVLEGNHNVRLERQIRAYNGELQGLRRANAAEELGVLTLGFLMQFEDMGVEYVTGYPEAEYWYSDHLKSYHGRKTGQGSVVAKEVPNETVNFVHGHTHRAGIVYRTFQDGRNMRSIFGMEVGTFADMSEIPSGRWSADARGNVLPQKHDWQAGLGVVWHNEELVTPMFVPITDKVMIDGRTYEL